MNKELRRCPFCGRKGELWNNKLTYRLYGVICEECDCMTPYFTTREEAIEAWNRRKPIDDIVEQLEEYEGTWSGRNRRNEYKDCDYEGGCAGCVNCKTEDAYRTAIEIVKSGGK